MVWMEGCKSLADTTTSWQVLKDQFPRNMGPLATEVFDIMAEATAHVDQQHILLADRHAVNELLLNWVEPGVHPLHTAQGVGLLRFLAGISILDFSSLFLRRYGNTRWSPVVNARQNWQGCHLGVGRHVVVELLGRGWFLLDTSKEAKVDAVSELEGSVRGTGRILIAGLLGKFGECHNTLGETTSPVIDTVNPLRHDPKHTHMSGTASLYFSTVKAVENPLRQYSPWPVSSITAVAVRCLISRP